MLGQQARTVCRFRPTAPPIRPRPGLTRAQAVRQPYFWLLASAVAVSGMLGTAVAFHQISLLTARGLTVTEAAANFIPQTIAGLGCDPGSPATSSTGSRRAG